MKLPYWFLFLVCLSQPTMAGTWGEGRWGTMIWGETPQAADGAPAILSVDSGAQELVFRLGGSSTDLPTGYVVTCTNVSNPVEVVRVEGALGAPVTVSDLTLGESYSCTAAFRNEIGQSDFLAISGTVTTELTKSSLMMIINAICSNDPDRCPGAI